jgi:hypothetical protein
MRKNLLRKQAAFTRRRAGLPWIEQAPGLLLSEAVIAEICPSQEDYMLQDLFP